MISCAGTWRGLHIFNFYFSSKYFLPFTIISRYTKNSKSRVRDAPVSNFPNLLPTKIFSDVWCCLKRQVEKEFVAGNSFRLHFATFAVERNWRARWGKVECWKCVRSVHHGCSQQTATWVPSRADVRRAFLQAFLQCTRAYMCGILPEGLSEGSHNTDTVSHLRVGALPPIVLPFQRFPVFTAILYSMFKNLYDLCCAPLPLHRDI